MIVTLCKCTLVFMVYTTLEHCSQKKLYIYIYIMKEGGSRNAAPNPGDSHDLCPPDHLRCWRAAWAMTSRRFHRLRRVSEETRHREVLRCFTGTKKNVLDGSMCYIYVTFMYAIICMYLIYKTRQITLVLRQTTVPLH